MKKEALLTSMLLFSPFLAIAQQQEDVVMSVGDTELVELGYDDVQPDSVLGGILGTIEIWWKRYVSYLGVDVWVDESYTMEDDFEMFCLPADQDIPLDWNVLTDNGVAYTSELHNGNTYDTHDFEYTVDSPVAYTTWGEGTGGNYGESTEAICDNAEPSLLEGGSGWTPTGYSWGYLESATNEVICKFTDGVITRIAGDWDDNGVIEGTELEVITTSEIVDTFTYGEIQFTTINTDVTKDDFETIPPTLSMYGVATVNSSAEALAILPAGTKDVYGIV